MTLPGATAMPAAVQRIVLRPALWIRVPEAWAPVPLQGPWTEAGVTVPSAAAAAAVRPGRQVIAACPAGRALAAAVSVEAAVAVAAVVSVEAAVAVEVALVEAVAAGAVVVAVEEAVVAVAGSSTTLIITHTYREDTASCS